MEPTQSLSVQPHPIPQDIRKELPDYWTPWGISQRLFDEMKSQKGHYKKVQVLPTDPEWRFVWKYFYHDKPKRWGIKQIYCIHERHQQQTFELNLSSIERETTKFTPTWNQEPRAPQRAKAIERWRETANAFSPFNTLENDGRQRTWKDTKVLPLWHGSSSQVADSVAESGFVYFGKTSLGGVKTKSTDVGFFGSGIYFTNSARYAADIYSSGTILMAWVSMREPFPVVGDDPQTDMEILQGKGAYKTYNAHYVPVTSADSHNPYEANYYPTKPGQDTHCDEIVIFQKSQAIARFWVDLEVEAPYLMVPSNIPQFVEDFIPHLFKILENPDVDKDKKLRNYIGQELAILLKLKPDDYLDDYGDKYELLYQNLTQLIDTQGKVKRTISRSLTGTPLPQSPSSQYIHPPSVPQSPLQPQVHVSTYNPPVVPIQPRPVQLQPFPSPHNPFTKALVEPQIPLQLYSPSTQPTFPSIAFGKAKWNTYFGDIGEEPPLPSDIQKILSSPCPFWPSKKVEQTHLLVLIPKTVNGNLFTLRSLAELIKKPKQGNATQFRTWHPRGNEDRSIDRSYWVLMTRDVLEGTQNKPYSDQTKIVANFRQKTGIDYQPPKLLEAATSILMEYVSQGTRLYRDGIGMSTDTYTKCQEKYSELQMLIGGFSAGGPGVGSSYDGSDYGGLAALRKF